MAATLPQAAEARCLSREEQLIVRLRVESLIAAHHWEEAAEIGAAAIDRGPASSQLLRMACRLTELGMVGGVSVVDTLVPLLCAPALHPADIDDGTTSVKRACADDLAGFSAALTKAVSAVSLTHGLALLNSALRLADSRVAPMLLARLPIERVVRLAMSDPQETRRACALQMLGALVRAAPAALCERLCPVLTTAALIEVPALQQFALACVGDVSIALARLPATDPLAAPASEQLAACLKLLSTCLYAPSVELQTIAALSLSKLALAASAAFGAIAREQAPSTRRQSRRTRGGEGVGEGGGEGGRGTDERDGGRGSGVRRRKRVLADLESSEDEDAAPADGTTAQEAGVEGGGGGGGAGGGGGTCGNSLRGTIFVENFDAESLIADLAYRYTAAQTVQLDTLPKAAAAPHHTLLAMLQCAVPHAPIPQCSSPLHASPRVICRLDARTGRAGRPSPTRDAAPRSPTRSSGCCSEPRRRGSSRAFASPSHTRQTCTLTRAPCAVCASSLRSWSRCRGRVRRRACRS